MSRLRQTQRGRTSRNLLHWADILGERVGLGAVFVVAAILVSCASGSDVPGDRSIDRSTATGPTRTSQDVFSISAYQGEEVLGGHDIDFASLLGQGKPVILNFWAALCPPCRLEMPWFEEAYQRHGDQVLLVGVDVGPFIGLGSNEQARALLHQLNVTYPAGAAADDRPVRQYRVLGMPTTVFFDAAGRQVGSHSGLLTQAQIDEAFRKLAEGETP